MPAMSVSEFAHYLSTKFDEDIVEVMQKNKISGTTLLKFSTRTMVAIRSIDKMELSDVIRCEVVAATIMFILCSLHHRNT